MTPAQKKFLSKVEETRMLHPEILQAIKVLSEMDLTAVELEELVVALSMAPLRNDPEFAIGGIIKG